MERREKKKIKASMEYEEVDGKGKDKMKKNK